MPRSKGTLLALAAGIILFCLGIWAFEVWNHRGGHIHGEGGPADYGKSEQNSR